MKIKDRFNYLAILASENEIPFGAARRWRVANFFSVSVAKKKVLVGFRSLQICKQIFLNEINYSIG